MPTYKITYYGNTNTDEYFKHISKPVDSLSDYVAYTFNNSVKSHRWMGDTYYYELENDESVYFDKV